jgi:ADP-ribose pyrophosphatase YjhB (NUDIX family)
MSSFAPDEAFARQLVIGSHAQGVDRLAVAAAIEDGDRILLIAIPGEDFTDTAWELPGDLVLPGETLLDALDRVVTITTGLEIDKVTGYLGSHDIPDTASTLRVFVFSVIVLDPGRICRAASIGHQWS